MFDQLIWACEPQALANFRALVARVGMGPVDDAERAGIRIKKAGRSAIIPINGMLLPAAPGWAVHYGYATRTPDIRLAVNAARQDQDIDRIILMIDSPGGSVQGVDDTAAAVRVAATKKTVITQVTGQMASAAYYIGSQATEIRAGRTDMIGSIGTRLSLWDLSKMFEKDGIEVLIFDTGEYKSAGEPGTPVTDNQKAYFQSVVDATQSYFRAAVQQSRHLDDKQYQAVADGRMWLAEEAMSLGLIDTIRRADETLAEIPNDTGHRRRTTAQARLRMQHQRRRAVDTKTPSIRSTS